MADKIKYIYGEQFAQKLPGSPNNPLLPNQGNFYFRTITGYKVDNNGKPIEGTARTDLYYAPKPSARTSDGKTWTPGTADSIDNFNPGGWVRAGSTRDGAKTYTFRNYSQEDADLGRIPPGKKVGDEVLGAIAQQSLTTSGGRFYEAVQNNLINLAANTQPGLAQVVSAKQKNAARGNPNPEIPTGTTEAIPSIESTKLKGTQLRIAPDFGLTYPFDRKPTQDRIKFQAQKILTRTGASSSSSGINLDFRFGQRNYENVDGPVFLAIQAGISDQNGVDWSSDTVNAIDAALYNASINLLQTETTQQLGEKVGDLVGQIQGELRKRGKEFGRYLAGRAAGINNVLARTDNIVLNPNMELLFTGPQLRPFTFQFKMSARDEPEAKEIKRIIKYFKYHMVPRKESTELFLKAPNIFKIEYQYGSSPLPHPGLNLIKECALTNCSVDYTPLGSYATYEDGTMISYTLSLQFQELEPVYDTDYTSSQSIGF